MRDRLGYDRRVPGHLGRYHVYDKIASGGMADVYLGRLPVGGNAFCALKVLREELTRDPQYLDMFQAEAKLLNALSHPATVQVYEVGFDAGRHFIAMELLVGQSLLSLWEVHRARRERLAFDLLAWIGARIADAVHHVHGVRDPLTGALENVVHRDVNPSNVLVTFDGRVKVIDFGLAKTRRQQIQTATGTVKGKIGYLSPEQLDGHAADARADVFALATTLWELSVDRRLFKAESDVATVLQISQCQVPDPRDLIEGYPNALWTILKRGLARDRDARYPTAGEMARDLYTFAASQGRNVGPVMLADLMLQTCVRA
jgi:eukaryotic-like serine/threonine-protein kinase